MVSPSLPARIISITRGICSGSYGSLKSFKMVGRWDQGWPAHLSVSLGITLTVLPGSPTFFPWAVVPPRAREGPALLIGRPTFVE